STQSLLLIVSSVLGVRRARALHQTQAVLPLTVRMILTFTLSSAAWLIYLTDSSGAPGTYSWWIAIGMSCSTVGDLVMASVIKVPNRLVGGIIAFAFAHASYTIAFHSLHTALAFESRLLVISICVSSLIALSLWRILGYAPDVSKALNFSSALYAIFIMSMGIAASFVAIFSHGVWVWPAIGAWLFIVSDALIALTEIRHLPIRHSAIWVWITYVFAQILILYGLFFV
ncbi:MAG: lysoplasmalogenase, partial [Bacilli bacterium]